MSATKEQKSERTFTIGGKTITLPPLVRHTHECFSCHSTFNCVCMANADSHYGECSACHEGIGGNTIERGKRGLVRVI